MGILLSLTKRNLLMFFRNKAEVFFSFLAAIIIVGLYVLFLSEIQIQSIEASVGEVQGAAALVNSWVMAGLIAVTTVTTSLGALGRIVADREKKVMDDFLVAPINRNHIFLSYILSTLIITFIISLALFIIAEIYIISSGGSILGLIDILKVLGIIIISVLSSSLLMLFIVSFLKNSNVLSVVASIVGTLIGFITGVYIPISLLPTGVQIISNILPVSQSAALLRQIFLDAPLHQVFVDAPEAMKSYADGQGVNLYFNNFELTSTFMVMYIIGSIVIFGIINIIRFKKMKNN